MIKKSYLVIGSIIFCLLFSFKAKAYTSGYSTVSGTDLDNNSYMVRGMTYYQMYPENYGEAGDDNYSAVWNVAENYQITLLKPNRYYTGVLRFRVQITSTSSDLQRLQPVLMNNQLANGLFVYIQGETSGYYQVDVVFDNYYCENESLGLPTILNTFTYPFNSEIGLTSYAQSFTLTLSIQLSSFRSQTTPFQNGLAGMITSSIDNSTALSVIAGWLYDIKTQDYSYYNQLVTQIAALTQSQNTANANLLLILNELDLDFQQVQTILDLFPSYRTQVLQYWQKLLQMNAAQSSAAADMDQDYGNKETQSAQLIDGLGSLNLPQVNQNDFNILGNVDSNSKANFFGLIGLITNNSLITTILIIIFTGAIVGYALYGKK